MSYAETLAALTPDERAWVRAQLDAAPPVTREGMARMRSILAYDADEIAAEQHCVAA